MPATAEIMTMEMGKNPAPKRVNMGPGQAPDRAQPKPKAPMCITNALGLRPKATLRLLIVGSQGFRFEV